MIPMSPRLLCCASFVQGNFVCDIGTDHAYLPAYLVMCGKCSRAIAADIREGPLTAAAGTVRRYGLLKQIRLIRSDGFEKIPGKGITDVVIAGMGGETIRDILSADCAKWLKDGVNLVLQPMTKAHILRRWLAENGFSVTKEIAVRDTHLYTAMQAHYTGEIRQLTEAESYTGALKRSDSMTRMYLAAVLEQLHTRAHGLEEAGHTEEAASVRSLIRSINESYLRK